MEVTAYLQCVHIYWDDVIIVRPQWRLDVIKYCLTDVTEYGFKDIMTMLQKYFFNLVLEKLF